MSKLISFLKRAVLIMPIVSIVGASFLLQSKGQQALLLFTLVWFYIFMIFDVFGK